MLVLLVAAAKILAVKAVTSIVGMPC
jgi:hypothetical protein